MLVLCWWPPADIRQIPVPTWALFSLWGRRHNKMSPKTDALGQRKPRIAGLAVLKLIALPASRRASAVVPCRTWPPSLLNAGVARARQPADRRGRPQRWRDAVTRLLALRASYAAQFEALPDTLQAQRLPMPRRPSLILTSTRWPRSSCPTATAATDETLWCGRLVMQFRADRVRSHPGCRFYFARRVTFLSCADIPP
jgi:hypothetical protein